MCYAIPGKIILIENDIAIIDYFGEHRKARIIKDSNQDTEHKTQDLELMTGHRKPSTGDYVYAQGGIIVDVVEEAEALAILGVWREMFFELKKTDARLQTIANHESNATTLHLPKLTQSRGLLYCETKKFRKTFLDHCINYKTKNKTDRKSELIQILEKAESDGILNNYEIQTILKTQDPELKIIYDAANRLRARHIQNACCVHGIIEFSNYCRNDCSYCGINKNNTKITRYRMEEKEIVETAVYAVKNLGFKALVLQSGEDLHYTDEMLVSIIKKIREQCGVLLFLSIGERPFETYKKLYGAGAYGALLRFETSNELLYASLHPQTKRTLKGRLARIHELKRIGFILATGFMVGLPGETEQDLLSNILLTKALAPDMYSFGPFLPHPCTTLARSVKPSVALALKTIALTRLVVPNSHILVTTALETLDKDAKRMGLLAGANSLMINVTPEKYREDYEIYTNKAGNDRRIQDTVHETLDLLYSLGRAPTDLSC